MSLRDEIKEFILYRNRAKRSYIAFVKQIYRTNEVSISQKEVIMNDKTIKELADNKNWLTLTDLAMSAMKDVEAQYCKNPSMTSQ